MTKRISALIIALLLVFGSVFSICAAAHPDRICDYADLLSDSEEAALRSYADRISIAHNCDVAVVTLDSIGSEKPRDAADDLFDYNGYGLGSKRSGILLLIVMDTRDYWISTCGDCITAVTDAGIGRIEDKMLPYLSDAEYYDAFNKYIGVCDNLLTRAENGDTYDVVDNESNFFSFNNLVMALVLGILIAFIVLSMMKGQLKTVRSQAAASNYMRHDSLRLTESTDLFLYSTVSRVARPKESRSSSSSHGGSSTHTSSSGTTHGGGGGKF